MTMSKNLMGAICGLVVSDFKIANAWCCGRSKKPARPEDSYKRLYLQQRGGVIKTINCGEQEVSAKIHPNCWSYYGPVKLDEHGEEVPDYNLRQEDDTQPRAMRITSWMEMLPKKVIPEFTDKTYYLERRLKQLYTYEEDQGVVMPPKITIKITGYEYFDDIRNHLLDEFHFKKCTGYWPKLKPITWDEAYKQHENYDRYRHNSSIYDVTFKMRYAKWRYEGTGNHFGRAGHYGTIKFRLNSSQNLRDYNCFQYTGHFNNDGSIAKGLTEEQILENIKLLDSRIVQASREYLITAQKDWIMCYATYKEKRYECSIIEVLETTCRVRWHDGNVPKIVGTNKESEWPICTVDRKLQMREQYEFACNDKKTFWDEFGKAEFDHFLQSGGLGFWSEEVLEGKTKVEKGRPAKPQRRGRPSRNVQDEEKHQPGPGSRLLEATAYASGKAE